MTNAEWTAEIANALAAREKLRRAHNAMGATVVDAAGGIRPDRAEAWRRYRAEQFLPASRRIEARVCELRGNVPDEVKVEAREIVKAGKLTLPAGATWAERMALLEAATVVFGERDPESEIVIPANCKEAIEPPQADLDAADITPSGAKAELPPDPTENFTAYTKIDPNSRFTVAASTVTVTGLPRNEDACIYSDKGAGHFGATFQHDVDFTINSISVNQCFFPWAVSNVVEDGSYWWTNYSEAACVFSLNLSPILYVRNNETRISAGQSISGATPYYLRIVRSNAGALVTNYIYTNAARTSLLASKSVELTGARTYRYVFAANSQNDGYATHIIGATVANLDLGEAAAARVPWHLFFNRGA